MENRLQVPLISRVIFNIVIFGAQIPTYTEMSFFFLWLKYSQRDDLFSSPLASSLWLRFCAPRRKISLFEEDVQNSFTVFLPANVPLSSGAFSYRYHLYGKEIFLHRG